jgi:hypothetical protein
VAVLAAGVGAQLARRLARPFEALTAAATRLGEGDFSVRAPRSGLEEADAIAVALDGTAERLGRAIDRSAAFTADASHQLRTPLTALRLHLESLELAGVDQDDLAAALTEADRLEATIAELTALTRLDAPEVALDLGALVADRASAWQLAARESDREVRTELLPVPAVLVRPAAIAQAVEVLVDNALQHGRGTVTVRVAPARPDDPEGIVRVSVEDEGEASTLERPGGRGLALARTLVAGEGGQLTVGRGARRDRGRDRAPGPRGVTAAGTGTARRRSSAVLASVEPVVEVARELANSRSAASSRRSPSARSRSAPSASRAASASSASCPPWRRLRRLQIGGNEAHEVPLLTRRVHEGLARRGARHVGLVLRDVQVHPPQAAGLELASGAEVVEHLQHAGVAVEDVAAEHPHPVVAGAGGQGTQQDRARTHAVVLVGDRDRGLRDVVLDHVTDVAGDPDARPVGAVEVDRDDRLVVDVVDLRQVVELRLAEVVDRAVEAQVARGGRQPAQPLDEPLPVLGPDLAQQHAAAVAQLDLA